MCVKIELLDSIIVNLVLPKMNVRYKTNKSGTKVKLCVGDNNTCIRLCSDKKLGLCTGHKNGTVRTPNKELKKGDNMVLNGIRYQYNGLQKVRLCDYIEDGILCEQVRVKDGKCKSHSPHWKCQYTGYQCHKIRTQGVYCVQHVGNIDNNPTMTKESFIKDAIDIHFGYYSYENVNFINATEKVDIRCPEHGLFSQRPCEHLRPRGCPKCKYSVGELRISKILTTMNIIYEGQTSFDTCRSIRPLPFDFWVPVYNLLIEFDGRQHFEEQSCWNCDGDSLLKRIKYDVIKDIWCLNNGKVLLRMSNRDINHIEEILKLAIEHTQIALAEEPDPKNPSGYIIATSFYDSICTTKNQRGIRDTSHYIIIT